jgi:hypothetical protein
MFTFSREYWLARVAVKRSNAREDKTAYNLNKLDRLRLLPFTKLAEISQFKELYKKTQ